MKRLLLAQSLTKIPGTNLLQEGPGRKDGEEGMPPC